MTIFCNGEPFALNAGASIQILIENLAIEPKGIAVAVDDSLVLKMNWASHILQDGCRVTVIRAAQGG